MRSSNTIVFNITSAFPRSILPSFSSNLSGDDAFLKTLNMPSLYFLIYIKIFIKFVSNMFGFDTGLVRIWTVKE